MKGKGEGEGEGEGVQTSSKKQQTTKKTYFMRKKNKLTKKYVRIDTAMYLDKSRTHENC